MDKRETSDSCAFDKLFATNVPHVHEKIFLSLDYFSFKSCLEVNKSWNELLTSESFLKKAKSTFDEWLKDAALKRDTDKVKLLLNLGAEPDKPDVTGWTALHFSAGLDNKGVVKVLLNGGANPNMTDDSGQSPLIRAVFYHHIDMVKILLDGGADPNVGILFGAPLLHLAAWKGHQDIVKLLLDRGADHTKEDESGRTPIRVAEEVHGWHGREDVVKLLRQLLDI